VKLLDRVLQRWRIEKARPYLRPGDRVLDVGSADGALFRAFPFLRDGVGIDPHIECAGFPPHARPVRGTFPSDLPDDRPFDAVTLMAMLEHVPESEQPALAQACVGRLRPGGLVLITVPSPLVDPILDLLTTLRLLDGMEVGQHHGFSPARTVPLFESARTRCVARKRFQLGLNSFFAFRKT
jgi:SAM-dependent methyltransferase